MKEFVGQIDDKYGVRFTFATLKIDFDNLGNSIVERAANFINGVFSELNAIKRKPLFALSLACFPNESAVDEELLKKFLKTVVEQMDKLSVPIVGGHTVESEGIIYTLILIEIIPRDELQIRQLKQKDQPPLPKRELSRDLFFEDRLIAYAGIQGCAAKYPPDKLDEILDCAISRLPLGKFGNLFLKEDVVLYHLDDDRSIAFSVDIIKPIVNSASLFGRIAITHAASDLYAKGISPLGVVGIILNHPSSLEVCSKIEEAGKEETLRLSSEYLGIYGIKAEELFYGALLYGECTNSGYISNSSVRQGDYLILTKPLGSGVVASYAMLRAFDLSEKETDCYQRMIQNMIAPSDKVARVMKEIGVNACTDITGFGLIGHLKEMIEPSNLGARVSLKKVLFLPCASAFYIKATYCSVSRNMHYFSKSVFLAGSVNNKSSTGKIALLYDAQTSGGLLISATPSNAKNILEILNKKNIKSAIIGEVIARNKFPIEIEA